MPKIYKDSLWKGVIEKLFPEFFDFFFEEWKGKIDLSRGFTFLDKELQKLRPTAVEKNRVADKLVKLYTREGEEQWILIHIEVQGYEDKQFEERMFTYFYRILDRYKVKIHALAILTDGNPNYLPNAYIYEFMGTRLTYSFDHYKLIHKLKKDFARKKGNPFSIIMETAWLSLQKQNDDSIFRSKILLIRKLLKSGMSKTTVENVVYFIKYYNKFKMEAKQLQLEETIEELRNGREPFGVIERIIVDLMETSKEEIEEARHELQLVKQEIAVEKQRVEKAKRKAEEEKRKAEEEKHKAEEAKREAEAEKQKAEKAKRKAEEGKRKAEAAALNTLKKNIFSLLSKGLTAEETARLLDLSPDLVEEVRKEHEL